VPPALVFRCVVNPHRPTSQSSHLPTRFPGCSLPHAQQPHPPLAHAIARPIVLIVAAATVPQASHHLLSPPASLSWKQRLIAYVDTSHALIAVCFAIYGMTYVLPSMLPYLPRYFTPKHVSDTIYLWMLVFQSSGDVLGRVCTMFPYQPSLTVLVAAMATVVFMFVVFTLGTIYRVSLPLWMPGYNGFVLPCCCLVYYFMRGYLITSIYVWVKLNYDAASAEKLSSNLGFAGQIGALIGTMIMFVVVSILDLFGGA